MGNKLGKNIKGCFTGHHHHHYPTDPSPQPLFFSGPLDENLGHSFSYTRPDPITRISSSKVHHSESEHTTFRTISGAAVSANTSTPLSTSALDLYYNSSAFDCTTSFTSVPLQPIPRNGYGSGPIVPGSGPLFMSGPIDRGFMSGPIDAASFQRSFSYASYRPRSKKASLMRVLQRAISKTVYRGQNLNSVVAPIVKKEPDWVVGSGQDPNLTVGSSSSGESNNNESCNDYCEDELQWAQGRAGEDRVHVVVSEEHGWVFVGIFDGFNGPDAPDYLLSNLYPNVHKELKGLLWDDKFESEKDGDVRDEDNDKGKDMDNTSRDCSDNACSQGVEDLKERYPCDPDESFELKLRRKRKYRGAAKRWEENQRRWKSEWDKERLELDRKLKEQLNRSRSSGLGRVNHGDVLKALSRALKKTEEAYLEVADSMLMENPELALMGSCVLVMLMKGEDVYVMNVGDSRAVLAQKAEPDYWLGKIQQDLECINEETMHDLEVSDGEKPPVTPSLTAKQLSVDHSTSMEEEVRKIRNEHPDDPSAVINDRVKGSLKVTRAFGAGFLKQPKWNNALLEVFRIEYMGTSPYISCLPSLYHHQLGSKDMFLILSSDGLYQYFTNEEAVSEVELFISLQPDGDPAQHLVEEVLFRAAKNAGMDFHELLEIPQGDRRRYHDDVSIIVISLEGRLWRSCV